MRSALVLALVATVSVPAVAVAHGTAISPDVPAWEVVMPGSATDCAWATGNALAEALTTTDPEIRLAPSTDPRAAGTPFAGALVSGSSKKVKKAPFVRVLAPLGAPASVAIHVSLDESGGWFDHATGIADALGVRDTYDALSLAQLKDHSDAFSGWSEVDGCGVGVVVDRTKRIADITFRPLWADAPSLAGPVPERVPAAEGDVTTCAWMTGDAFMAAFAASDGYTFAPDPSDAGTPREGSLLRKGEGVDVMPVITVNRPFDRAADLYWAETPMTRDWHPAAERLGDLLGVPDQMVALVAQADAAGDEDWSGWIEADGCLLGIEQVASGGFVFITARPIWTAGSGTAASPGASAAP